MLSIICVYAACLRPSCASTVEADSMEKHYGLAASTEWAGGLGLGGAGLQVSDWVAAQSSRTLRPRPAGYGAAAKQGTTPADRTSM